MSTKAEIPPDSDVMRWRGQQSRALLNETREEDIEGALRASKTTICLRKRLRKALRYPGIHILIARWTDDATHGILKPAWRAMCDRAGVKLDWNGEEQYDELANGSRVFIRGLKTQDQTNRYAKFRGLTLADVYVDQAEELPHDIYLELAARLSQKGFPHQITISPNAIEEDHWIAKEFPEDNRNPHRTYIPLSVHDNAHNLSPEVIPSLERLYTPDHPKHRTMVLGRRGMNVTGEPVYKGAFVRSLHEGVVKFDPSLTLEMSLDFGKHHPCALYRQVSSLGQRRYVGGIFGQDMYLDAFIDIVLTLETQWFPAAMLKRCCDPAGAADTSHGTKGAVKTLKEKGLTFVSVPDSNSPIVRLAMIEQMAASMRKRVPSHQEAFVISDDFERWRRVSVDADVPDRFLAAGCEAGYVWSPHTISVANKQVRVPKKDGWYEHGQNCAEYLEVNFSNREKPKEEPPPPPPYRPTSAWA